MVKRYLNKCLVLLAVFASFWLGQTVHASNDYAALFVTITDATTAVQNGDQETAKQLVADLQEAFAQVANHDSAAGKKVTKALAITGDIKEDDLVAVSKALLTFDEEQHPVDEDSEKAKLLAKMTPQYEAFQAALDSKDLASIKSAYVTLNNVWTRNEGIVRKNAAHYGKVETAISFLRSAIETSPVDYTAIQSNFDDTKAAIQSFVDGEAVKSTSSNLTLADGIDLLKSALADFQDGNTEKASKTMKEFVTIWPSIEGDISTRDNALYTRVESESPVIMVKGQEKAYQKKLQALIEDLSAIDTTAGYNFVDAALILLREGVEALLIVLALVSTLRVSKHKKGLPWVYGGALAGIAASIAVAIALQTLFPTLSAGTNREILEGAVGIFAVVMMILVGIWLHSKSSVKKWNDFMDKQMQMVTATGSFVSMFALSFLAVFREGAETILFYVGILPRIEMSQLLLGIGVAVGALVLMAVVMLKVTGKIVAYKVFFYLTWLIYALAFKMLGVSLHALQLTNMLPNHLVSGLPTVEWMGIYPSWEVIIPQVVFLVIVLIVTVKNREHDHV